MPVVAELDSQCCCPFCPGNPRYAHPNSLRNHLNRSHRNADLAAVRATHPECTVCDFCGDFCFNTAGLHRHQARSRACQERAAAAATTNVDLDTQLPIPQANGQVGSDDLTVQELEDLISGFRYSLHYRHHSWRNAFAQVCEKLLLRFHSPSLGTAQSQLRAAAAFLVLPGVIREQQLRKVKIRSFLDSALQAGDTSIFLLNVASTLRRGGRGTPSLPQARRSLPQLQRKLESLVDTGRLRSALCVVETMRRRQEGTDDPIALSVDEQRDILRDLHPSATEDDVLSAPEARIPRPSPFTSREIEHAVRSLRHSAAPGWTGWTNRAVSSMVLYGGLQGRLLHCLRLLADRFAFGNLTSDVASLFTVSRAVLIPKDDGRWRPLGIGEVWYRLFARALSKKLLDPTLVARLLPLQMGCGVKGGSEISARLASIVHDLDSLEDGDFALASLDIANAFNSLRRRFIMEGIQRHCGSLEGWFRLCYGKPSHLRLSDGSLVGVSHTGVRQGDPLAFLCFCLGFHSALEQLSDLLHSTPAPPDSMTPVVWAYADDVVLAAPAAVINRAGPRVREVFDDYQLSLVPAKCRLLGNHFRSLAVTNSTTFTVMEQGIPRLLGAPVGSPDFCREILEAALDKCLEPLPTLTQIAPQSAYILLNHCVNARASYLSRVCEFPGAAELFNQFDARIAQGVADIAKCPLTETTQLAIHLPTRLGGLGVVAHSGLVGELHRLSSRTRVTDFIASHLVALRAYGTAWPCLDLVDRARAAGQTPAAFVACLHEESFKTMLTAFHTAGQLAHEAWLRSNCFAGSGRWLSWRGGLQSRYRMDYHAYRDALRLRLLNFSTVLQLPRAHRCRTREVNFVDEPFHLLDCAGNQRLFRLRHDRICDLLREVILGCLPSPTSVMREEPLEVPAGHREVIADLVVRGEALYVIDVSLTSPACRTSLGRGSFREDDAASRFREGEKRLKYAQAPLAHGGGCFVPFVIEATWRLGPSARAFLDTITGENTMRRSAFLDAVGACIAQANSWMLSATRERVLPVVVEEGDEAGEFEPFADIFTNLFLREGRDAPTV